MAIGKAMFWLAPASEPLSGCMPIIGKPLSSPVYCRAAGSFSATGNRSSVGIRKYRGTMACRSVEPNGFSVLPAHFVKIKKPPEGGLFILAERVGFEPTVGLHQRLISSQVHSTTLPPLQKSRADYRRSRVARASQVLRGLSTAAVAAPLGMKKNSPLSWPAKRIGAYCGCCGKADLAALRASEVCTSWNTRCASTRRLLSCKALRKAL